MQQFVHAARAEPADRAGIVRASTFGAYGLVHGLTAGMALRNPHQSTNLGREGAEYHLDFFTFGTQSLQGADGGGAIALECAVAQIE